MSSNTSRQFAIIEPLDSRKLLSTSISAATLVGPMLTKGAQFVFSATDSTKLNITENLIGTTTFNKIKTVEDDVSLSVAPGEVNHMYLTLDSNGLREPGNKITFKSKSQTTTNSPPQTLLPASMTAGKKYTFTSTSSLLSKSGGTKRTGTFELMSSTESTQKVTAGTFKAYEVDLSITNSGSKSTETEKEWWSPTVGLIKLIDSVPGSPTLTAQLASYKLPKPAAPTTHLTFGKSPTSTAVGATIKPAVLIDIKDASGHILKNRFIDRDPGPGWRHWKADGHGQGESRQRRSDIQQSLGEQSIQGIPPDRHRREIHRGDQR